ncbi:MAG: NAD(P)H-hydrate dehydratase [Rhodothalassiaceae bacterium]
MLRLPVDTPARLLTPAEMARADQATIAAGTDSFHLMQNAAAAVAECVMACAQTGPVAVLAGPGNNGGDAFVVADMLRRAGREVRLACLVDSNRLSGDAARAAAVWGSALAAFQPDLLDGAAVILDGLFGAGLSRDVDGLAATLLRAANDRAARRIAIDIPSGIDGDTGKRRGTAFQAEDTVTFERAKPGHRLLPGALHSGRVHVRRIGLDPAALGPPAPVLADNAPALFAADWPVAGPDDHKYRRGHAVVVGGGAPFLGAARLAAGAALRAGAGLVTLATPADSYAIQAASQTTVMVRPIEDDAALADFLEDPRVRCLVYGPGAGRGARTRQRALILLERAPTAVLDADALTSFADAPDMLFERLHANHVLTPHDGEFARLFGIDTEDRLAAVRQAAHRSGAVVVLKGAATIIADPTGDAVIDYHPLPHLATAGTGDVLAGLIGGLLAQGVPGGAAAAIGVRLHRLAAAEFGEGLIAEDLLPALPQARSKWRQAARRSRW